MKPRPWRGSRRTSSAASKTSPRPPKRRTPPARCPSTPPPRGGPPGPAAPAGRGRHRGAGGAVVRHAAELRRALGRRNRQQGKVRPQPAGAAGRADDRPGRPPRGRAHARHPRAAHPPREGDLEHLHQPGPVRAGGHHLSFRLRQAGPARAGRAEPGQGALPGRRAGKTFRREARFHRAVLQRVRGQRRRRRRPHAQEAAREEDGGRGRARALVPGAEEPPAALRHRNREARRPRPLRGGRRRGAPMSEKIRKAAGHVTQSEALLFEKSSPGKRGYSLPPLDVPAVKPEQALGAAAVRAEIAGFPEVSEIEIIRHFTRLSTWNYGVDTGMYPLGSCTMKYNPRVNEVCARLAGLATEHPAQPEELSQGCLRILQTLESCLIEITGMDAITLQPAAGAHGELTGVLLTRAYLESKGNPREVILIPDSAHGTNPATPALAGYRVENIKSNPDGRMDLDSLREKMTEKVAALMITNPNTLGVFEKELLEIAEIVPP